MPNSGVFFAQPTKEKLKISIDRINPINNDEVAYIYDDVNWTPNRSIRLRDTNTGDETIIVDENNHADHNMTFSPKGLYLLWSENNETYTSYEKLKKVNINTQEVTTIIDNSSFGNDCKILSRYTQDGNYIYFSVKMNNNMYNIYKCNSDGSNQEELMNSTVVLHSTLKIPERPRRL